MTPPFNTRNSTKRLKSRNAKKARHSPYSRHPQSKILSSAYSCFNTAMMKTKSHCKIHVFFGLAALSVWFWMATELNMLAIQYTSLLKVDDGPNTQSTGDRYDIPLLNLWTNDSIVAQKQTADMVPAESQWLKSPIDLYDHHWTRVNSIPKRIHKVYLDKFGTFPEIEEKNEMSGLEEAHKSWILKNPGYSVNAFNLAGCRKYLAKHFHPIFLRTFDCVFAFSAKANFFRMAVVYREGGWYSDWKQMCLQDGLLESLGSNVSLYVVWDHGNEVSVKEECLWNGFFGASPSHPIIANMLRMTFNNVHDEFYGASPIHPTGTCLFNRAYKKFLNQENPNKTSVREGIHKSNKVLSSVNSSLALIQHKCDGCGSDQNWKRGNNYNKIWKKRRYYCADAKSLFESADLQR